MLCTSSVYFLNRKKSCVFSKAKGRPLVTRLRYIGTISFLHFSLLFALKFYIGLQFYLLRTVCALKELWVPVTCLSAISEWFVMFFKKIYLSVKLFHVICPLDLLFRSKISSKGKLSGTARTNLIFKHLIFDMIVAMPKRVIFAYFILSFCPISIIIQDVNTYPWIRPLIALKQTQLKPFPFRLVDVVQCTWFREDYNSN